MSEAASSRWEHIGTHSDGRQVLFDRATRSAVIGSTPITLAYLAKASEEGRIAWVGIQWRDWVLAQAGISLKTREVDDVDVVGRRIGAFVIDVVLINLAQLPLVVPMVLAASSGEDLETISRVISLTISAVYFIVGEAVWGRTLGKAVLGLRVVSESGGRIGLMQSLVRNAARFVDMLFLCIPALVSISNSPLKQRIGDRWAGTLVVGG